MTFFINFALSALLFWSQLSYEHAISPEISYSLICHRNGGEGDLGWRVVRLSACLRTEVGAEHK